MNTDIPDILVVQGPLKDARFVVPETGLRLGRSSSCEISISDPALSRNHCLFEVRDGQLWVTDLASANGTQVNDVQLGADSKALRPGDRVFTGETVLAIVEHGGGLSAPAAETPRIDLGLGQENPPEKGRIPPMRIVLWGAAVLAAAGAATVIVTAPGEPASAVVAADLPDATPVLHAFSFEKVEADSKGIYRYALSLDIDGTMTVAIDDIPKENRHVKKSIKLEEPALKSLAEILSVPELYRLDKEYTGVPPVPGTLKSFSLRVLRGKHVFGTTIENAQEPDAFRAVRERLETFSKNELGIWAIQFSAEKLLEMSEEARRAADAKWEERDVQHGNIAAALASYDEAVFYLETVDPKPAGFADLVNRRKTVSDELERRYRDQRFLADRAINLKDWPAARRELRVLCELLPSEKDPRHAEAAAKLLDVESRMKK